VKRAFAILLGMIVVSCGGAAGPATTATAVSGSVTVFAASSLTDALTKAGEALKVRHAGTNYVFSFGSSSTLATQIANGAPADLFASADEVNMQKIVDSKLTDGGPSVFASNRLAIAVAPGNPKRVASLADLGRTGLVVILAAPAVPAGRYALESLTKAGVTVTPASQELDARSVLNKVAIGEADAGIVYVTDVLSAGVRVSGVDIPEQHQVVGRYPIAVVSGTMNSALAREFVAYLVSDEGQRLLAGFGFSRP
jgi:molybdate transport system substrate-binding protein